MKPCKLTQLPKQFVTMLFGALCVVVLLLAAASESQALSFGAASGEQAALIEERQPASEGASLAVIQNPRQVALVLDGLLRSIVYSAADSQR